MSRILKEKQNLITYNYNDSHKAIDIVGNNYSLDYIIAHSDGVVVNIEKNYQTQDRSDNSYGNYIKIKHDNGYYTLYAHLKYGSIPVNIGDKIKKGQTIGYMGNTGNTTGAHLHFEVRNQSDTRINPTPYINADLPGTSTNNNTEYIVKKGDTLSEIASRYNTTTNVLASYNNISNPNLININQIIKIPSEVTYYTVKKGDTLSSIASKYKSTWQKIYEDNKQIIGNNPSLIIPGQKLIIK